MKKEDLLGSGGSKNRVELVRESWIDACRFHTLSERDVLQEVSRRVTQHEKASVLLDLDSTLYEVRPRTHKILLEWAESKQEPHYSDFQKYLLKMDENLVKYSVRETFSHLEISKNHPHGLAAAKSAEKFWFERFFTNQYLTYDRSYPGAAEFAQNLYQLGAEVIYLTGRDEPNMGEGTRANLLRDGFPWALPRTHLLMKAKFEEPDLDHKLAAAGYIRRHGTLVASFENEPPNVVALSQVFPDAMHVFVDTVCSDLGAMPCDGLYRIRNFR